MSVGKEVVEGKERGRKGVGQSPYCVVVRSNGPSWIPSFVLWMDALAEVTDRVLCCPSDKCNAWYTVSFPFIHPSVRGWVPTPF